MSEIPVSPLPPAAPPPEGGAPSVVADVAPGGLLMVQLAASLGLGVLVAIVCGVAWGTITYYTERIFLQVAILVGLAITWVMRRPFGRLGWLGSLLVFIPAALLTVGAVILGDLVTVTLTLVNEYEASPVEAFLFAVENIVEIEQEGGAGSLIFAVFGVGLSALSRFRRPRA